MLGMTYKEGIKPEEILYCLAYKEAYEKVYQLKVPHPLRDVPLKIKEFLDLVDQETLKIKQRYETSRPKLSSAQDIIKFLEQAGFELVESG